MIRAIHLFLKKEVIYKLAGTLFFSLFRFCSVFILMSVHS